MKLAITFCSRQNFSLCGQEKRQNWPKSGLPFLEWPQIVYHISVNGWPLFWLATKPPGKSNLDGVNVLSSFEKIFTNIIQMAVS